MLWTILKIAIFLLVVTVLAWGAILLAQSTEPVIVQGFGYEVAMGPLQAAIAAGLVLLALWLGLRVLGLGLAFVRFLRGDETALSRWFDRNRERKGYRALGEGLVALAAGEGRAALAGAQRAEKYLGRGEATNILLAQAAESCGETRIATGAYKRLLRDERTRFVGVRGLMLQKLGEGDTDTALKLAEKAFAMRPTNVGVQDTLLKLQAETGDWKGAREVLSAKARQKLLPKDVARRRDAVMALQEARGLLDESASIEAQEAAIAASKASPDLIPAAVIAAESYIARDKPKNAARVLEKAWAAQPHPDLASAYARIVPDENPGRRLGRFEALLRQAPQAEESRLLRAELLIAAEDFPGARRALGDLPETRPTARCLTIMAAIERGEGAADSVVRGWLVRAVTAPRGPQWICEACGTAHEDWAPVCSNCAGFDTLAWTEAPARGGLAHGAEMLPLIVGAPDLAPDLAEMAEADVVAASDEAMVEEAVLRTAEPHEAAPAAAPSRPAPQPEVPLEDAVALARRTP